MLNEREKAMMNEQTDIEYAARKRAFEGAFRGDGGYLPGKAAVCGYVDDHWEDYLTDEERNQLERLERRAA